MIYLDTSVALAELFAEDRKAPEAIWTEPLVSSRLLEYELWTRIHARSAASSLGDSAREILAHVSFVELVAVVLSRALEPFSVPVRTLDAIHLATLHYLMNARQRISLAAFDDRLRRGAQALGVPLAW